MTIRINQIAVDFTLEKEKTFADLVGSFRTWARAQNLAILGILADGKALSPEDQRDLSSVSEVDVEAVPAGQQDLARVAVVARFFSLAVQGWTHKNQSLLEELHEEFPKVRAALFPLLNSVAPRLQNSLAILDGPWTEAPEVQKAIEEVALVVETVRKELQDPDSALEETLLALEELYSPLEALGGYFQKGQDKEGFSLILKLLNLLEDLGRRAELIFQTGGDRSGWDRFHRELQPLLEEAAGALSSGDFILLTDLLEYEVTPRLKEVRLCFATNSNLDPASHLL